MAFKKHIPAVLLLILIATIFMMGSVPPVSRDALTHHLAVPKLYVQEGGVHELPHISFSYYPQLIDYIYCIPMIFGNDIVPKYIHFAFALLTALIIFFYLRRRLNNFYGILGTLFFLSLPVIVKLSVTVYVDLGLIFFSTASLINLLRWHEKKLKFRYLFISALCCGLALSSKYNGLVTCFILTAFTPLIYLSAKKIALCKKNPTRGNKVPNQKKFLQIKAAGYGLCFLCICLAVFSPWMIKNYIWTKNPVYPLYNNYFNPMPAVILSRPKSKPAMTHFLVRKHVFKESWLETASIPLRIFFQGEDDNPKYFDGRLNPLLFILPLFAFISPKKKSAEDSVQKRILLFFSILYILIVFFQQDMRIRWMGPAIPPLVILSAYGLKNIFQLFTPEKTLVQKNRSDIFRIIRLILFIMIFSMASLNAVYIYQLFKKIAPQTYITHQVTRSEYIEKFRPEYTALQFANHHLKGDIKLLAFFLGNRRYYSMHDIRFNHPFFKKLVQESKTANDIFQGLRRENFTNLIVDYTKLNSWINNSFNPIEKKRIQDFFKQNTTELFSKSNHGLYQLKE